MGIMLTHFTFANRRSLFDRRDGVARGSAERGFLLLTSLFLKKRSKG